MRTLAVVVTSALALMVAGAASAAPTLTFIWSGASNVGATGIGTDTLGGVTAGDTVTLDIIIQGNDVPLAGGSVSLDWTPGDFTMVSGVECPSPPNLFAGGCTPNGDFSAIWSPALPGVTIDNVAGTAIQFDAFSSQFSTNAATLGRAVFTVGGLGVTINSLYTPADGLVISGGAVTPAASATIVPEPSTMGLLALGLGALGMVGRRRS